MEIWTENGTIVNFDIEDSQDNTEEKDIQNKNRAMDTYYASNIVFGNYVFIFFGNINKKVRINCYLIFRPSAVPSVL